MDAADAAEALAMCAAYDNRTPTRIAADAWAATLPDIALADAKAAIVGHYTESREWVMPADVRKRVRAIRDERLASGTAILGIPDADPDDVAAYIAAQREMRHRIASGEEVARPVVALIEQAARRTRVPARDEP